MQPVWNIQKPDLDLTQSVCQWLNCHPAIATVLVNRGISTRAGAEAFFDPSFKHLDLSHPLVDMDRAVVRIYQAVLHQEPILIFGDYDADGITATVILYKFLIMAGAVASYYIPHRINEGYGLKARHIQEVALARNIRLLITVDCGSTSHLAVQKATDAGIDIIITDHHQIIKPFPQALAVINPKRHDNPRSLTHLAGVGVAFLLVLHLRRYFRENRFWKNQKEPLLKPFCELVALGTIADMVPLIDMNRILVKTGMEMIAKTSWSGVRSLLDVSGLTHSRIHSEDIAFRLSPRLNAAGRMEDAGESIRLLLSQNPESAMKAAGELNRMNLLRQKVEKQVVSDIVRYIDTNPDLLKQKSIVLSHSNWPVGILGIAASKLMHRYHRHVILINVHNGHGKGSARSIPGFDLYQGLFECRDCLDGFGGHQLAAGIEIQENNIPEFQKRFDTAVSRCTSDSDFIPVLQIDCHLEFDSIHDRLMDELEKLEPYGQNNSVPIFITHNVTVQSSRIVGEYHRQLVLGQSTTKGEKLISAIQFNVDPNQPLPRELKRMAYRLRWNYWNGNRTPQIIIEST
jgi:single-stranded-DNA-specific exonuclease